MGDHTTPSHTVTDTVYTEDLCEGEKLNNQAVMCAQLHAGSLGEISYIQAILGKTGVGTEKAMFLDGTI